MSPGMRNVSTPAQSEEARLVVQGRNLSIQLCVLLRTARIHDVGNVAFQGPLAAFIETVDQIWTAEGDFELQVVGDYLYINHNRLRARALARGVDAGRPALPGCRPVGRGPLRGVLRGPLPALGGAPGARA